MPSAILAFVLMASIFSANQAFAQEQIMLEASSDKETFRVKITWIPADIGSTHTFDIRFVEPETSEEIEDVLYDFSIHSGDNRELLRRGQTTARQEFAFDKTGSYEIRIDDIEGLGERVTIPIQVTPEFPFGTSVLAGAIIITAMLVARRSNSNNLFRL